MVFTHTVFSVAGATILLGTANPVILGIAAISSQLPDIDTSKSTPGRILFPISRLLERHFPHRSVTHSFIATLVIALAGIPLMMLSLDYWQALVLGYFFGWFADVFTKSGVCAFYPSAARLVIPANPRLRLSTGSGAEVFILVLLMVVAIGGINISSSGGILKAFNQVLGLPGGAIETIGEDGNEYLMFVEIKGRSATTQERIDTEYEVIKPLTQNDLLVKDRKGQIYRAGSSQESQILVTQMRARRGPAIDVDIKQISLDSEELVTALAGLPVNRTYLTGTLNIEDAADLQAPSSPQFFATITLQPAQDYSIAHIESASPRRVYDLLGSYYATGSLVVRSINVR